MEKTIRIEALQKSFIVDVRDVSKQKRNRSYLNASNCCKAKVEQHKLCSDCKADFDSLLKLLKELKINYTYQPALVRGLDYYTNTVFEIVSKKLGAQDALGAGGRYNSLVKDLGGPDIPAVGFALGLERILLVLDQEKAEPRLDVFLVTTDSSFLNQALEMSLELRAKSISCDLDYSGRSLKAQLRVAQKRGAKFVVILGEEELREGAVLIKDMDKSTQEKVKKERLVICLEHTLAEN